MSKKAVIMAVLLALVAMSLVPPVLAIDGAPAISEDNSKDTGATVNPEGAGQWPVPGDPILQSRFGVNLALQAGTGVFPNSFNLATFAPTANVDTVDWAQDDWYGDWNTTDFTIGTTQWGTVPSGGERYDVEAIYFDNDQANFYIAIVTSVPHYLGAPGEVGVYEGRLGNDTWMRPGDLSINLGLNDAPRAGWYYDYGVDIVHENRDLIADTVPMRDDNLGNLMYRTANDSGTDENPTDSDWYTSAPGFNVVANYEHTNFDPASTFPTTPAPQLVGATTVDYYELDFGGDLENGAPTYVIEVTIPRDLFGDDDPGHGDTIGILWVEGCRNDATGTEAVIYLEGDVDDIETGDAPDSTNHWGTPNYYTDDPAETAFGNFPTVSDPDLAGNAPYGMCHVVCPTCAYLGDAVSAERDADLAPDTDIPGMSAFTNITPPNLSNNDTDDGLLLPVEWEDGTPATLSYFATLPPGGAAGTRYVNVWFDWNRDGDWADASVACYPDDTPHSQDEWVVQNNAITLTSAGTVQVDVPFTPCNPTGEEVRIWVRVTMSDELVENTDGSGPGYCYNEGETEDYLTMAPPPLAVELASFGAKPAGGGILVEWETVTEIDNVGFSVYRSEAVDGPRVQLNESMIPSAVAPGSLVGASYSLLDTDVVRGTTYYYWLEDMDIHGVTSLHGPESATAPIIRLSNSLRRIAPALGR